LTNAAKIGLTLGIVGLGAWLLSKLFKPVDFKLRDLGVPSLSGSTLTVPLIIDFTNNTQLPVKVDDLSVTINFLMNGGWVYGASLTKNDLSVQPGLTSNTIPLSINLKSIFSNALDILSTIARNGGLDLSIDFNAHVHGLPIKRTYLKHINL
jgi:hypothetical protein